jgi:uncharacterized protein
MRIGIHSDTHDELSRTQLAIQALRDAGAEVLIHCGDLASPPIIQALSVLPSWLVFGNHDADMVPALKQAATDFGPVCLGCGDVIELARRRVGVVHGHMRTDLQGVLAKRPEFLLSGHSHLASDRVIEGVRRINPGALHHADEYTVGLLDLSSGESKVLSVG